jgi:hypothetical protein
MEGLRRSKVSSLSASSKLPRRLKGRLKKARILRGTLIIADDDWVPVPENKRGFRRAFRM